MGEARDVKFRMAEGDVPKFVRLEDGSSRVILSRVDGEGSPASRR